MRRRREGRKVGILRTRPPARRWTFPDGENVPKPCFLPRHAKIRRATLQCLCPQGKQRRIRTPAAPLARRARQRTQGSCYLLFPREMRVCDRMARGGERNADLTRSSLRGRRAPCPAGASPAAQSPAAQSPKAPKARKLPPPQIHLKPPSPKFRSPKLQTPQRPNREAYQRPRSLRTSHFQHSPNPRRPRPKRRLPSPTAAGGRPLRVGLPPSTRTFTPFGTKRSAQAPCSWGLGA